MKSKENKTQFFLYEKTELIWISTIKKIIMKTTKISKRMHTFIKPKIKSASNRNLEWWRRKSSKSSVLEKVMCLGERCII